MCLYSQLLPPPTLSTVSATSLCPCLCLCQLALPVQAVNSKVYSRLAPIPVMMVSSIFHEYVLAVALKYCIPFLTIEFVLLGGMYVCGVRCT